MLNWKAPGPLDPCDPKDHAWIFDRDVAIASIAPGAFEETEGPVF